ncbi:MAG: phosphate/phosphite/phosphonate ABC transporter substrate-binding protein [Xenococcus sp. (in: cyanobacteria)]
MLINKNKFLAFASLALTLFSMVACNSSGITSEEENIPAVQPTTPVKAIVLADISDNPQKKIRRFQPLADYLAANLSDFEQGKVKIAPDMATLIAWLKSGEVDIYVDSPYPAMLASNGAAAKPILRRCKKGQAEYYSLIFTIRDRRINSLADLPGKTIALEDPFSTTGYMLPLSELIESGLNPREQSLPNSSVPDDAVGYVFSNEDENSIEWLLSGKVDAAAIDNRNFERLSPEIKEQVVILAETEKIPRNLVLVRGDLPPDQIESITSVLAAMDQTEEGKMVLEKFSRTTKFDRIPTTESLNRIQELYQQTQHNLSTSSK